jgi:hypothetical protein
MDAILAVYGAAPSVHQLRSASKRKRMTTRQSACQPPPKPNACANEPKPPRLTDELDDEPDEDEEPPDEELSL